MTIETKTFINSVWLWLDFLTNARWRGIDWSANYGWIAAKGKFKKFLNFSLIGACWSMTLTKYVLKNKLIVPFHCITQSAKRWATNLGGSNTQNGRDSAGRRLGVKLGNGMCFYICSFYFGRCINTHKPNYCSAAGLPVLAWRSCIIISSMIMYMLYHYYTLDQGG